MGTIKYKHESEMLLWAMYTHILSLWGQYTTHASLRCEDQMLRVKSPFMAPFQLFSGYIDRKTESYVALTVKHNLLVSIVFKENNAYLKTLKSEA